MFLEKLRIIVWYCLIEKRYFMFNLLCAIEFVCVRLFTETSKSRWKIGNFQGQDQQRQILG